MNGKIYVAGGQVASNATNKAEVYDPLNNQWTSLPDMNVARSGAMGISASGLLYMIGGYSSQILDSVEFYDPVTNTWNLAGKLPIHLRQGSSAKLNGVGYVLSGKIEVPNEPAGGSYSLSSYLRYGVCIVNSIAL